MSASVKISRRTAQTALAALVKREPSRHVLDAERDLEHALAPKRAVVARAKRTRAKRKTKREETAAIREAVFARAEGLCDYCEINSPSELEHPHGRVRVKQGVETCLAACGPCHRARHRLEGGAIRWWKRIAAAFALHGCELAERLARDEVAKHEAKAALDAGRAEQSTQARKAGGQ